MKILMIPLAALAMGAAAPVLVMGAAAPAMAKNYDNGPRDRDNVSRGELYRDRDRIEDERRDLRDARYRGDRDDVRDERRDLKRAQKEYRQDAKDWRRGRNYSYQRPDPRYNGYYADNYYRSGANYQPRFLGPDDRIYRGRDNRYYCRRNDGTTGLIIGAVGGGVLGNVIAPGGSKTLGTVLGGGLGALLGNSIGRGNVTCR